MRTDTSPPAQPSLPGRMARVVWLSVVMAVLAGLAYFLTGAGVLSPGLSPEEVPGMAIPLIAGGCYVVGGLLITLRKRGLLIAGAIVNALVMGFFFAAYTGRPEVMFSSAGILTKSAQLILEIGLFFLIVSSARGRTRR